MAVHPDFGDLPAAVTGLAARFGRETRASRAAMGWYVLVASALSIAVLSAVAVITHEPFVFPSLGPTAFLLFYAATSASSSPRNVCFGHLIAVVCGYAALLAFGLTTVAPDLEDITWQRVGAVTLALCSTLSIMVWLGVPHAPAGATTLIVALGLMRTPAQLAILMLAVVALIALAWIINRTAGVPYPDPSARLPE
jgi:CBS domain-containing membrane protein